MPRQRTCLVMCVSVLGALALPLVQSLAAVQAVDTKIDVSELVKETQKMSRRAGELTLVWWIPEELWQASLAQAGNAPPGSAEQVSRVVHPYLMVGIVEGKVGPFGGVTYSPESSLKAKVVLTDAEGSTFSPLPENAVQADARNMLQFMKPPLANILGPLGENLYFVMFPAENKEGQRIAEASRSGKFSIKVGDQEFTWRLPLDSLLPTLICPKCKEECRGSWSYCPWCGTKLK